MPIRRGLRSPVAALVAPLNCGGCGEARPSVDAGAWCEHCRDRWGPAPGWWDAADSPPNPAPGCPGWAAASYRGRVRRAVLQGKRGAPQAAIELLLARWPAAQIPADACVSWVPAHPRRAVTRPDSGRVIAEALAARDGLSTERLLWRVPWARRQAGRTDEARRAAPERLGLRATGPAPLRVVLVDDVRTTGTTLDHAAVLLRAAGAAHVVALTVAAAHPPGGWPAGQLARPSGGRGPSDLASARGAHWRGYP